MKDWENPVLTIVTQFSEVFQCYILELGHLGVADGERFGQLAGTLGQLEAGIGIPTNINLTERWGGDRQWA